MVADRVEQAPVRTRRNGHPLLRRALRLAAACAVGTFLLAACGSRSSSAARSAAPAADWSLVLAEYRKYAVAEIDALVTGTEAFVAALAKGDVAGAKALYALTRMHYERVEPIAEGLGELDPRIDAREGDVPDAEWRGFHRIEKSLWIDGTTAGTEAYASVLLDDVRLLRAKVEAVQIGIGLLVTGAVELLNEVSTTKVTGEQERYSHTDLYDFAANVQGSRVIFDLLRPAVEKRDADLARRIGEKFLDLEKALSAYRTQDGAYVAYTALAAAETRALSQAVDALAEPLSQIARAIGET